MPGEGPITTVPIGNNPARRSSAIRSAAFALYPIMEREGLKGLQKIAAGELATAAIEEYERVIKGGEIRV